MIPPAWTEVWICPDPDGHLQVTGHDVKGRKQYRYHPRWREVRDENKYDRLINFAQALPRIRRRVARDLGRKHLPQEKVLAAVVKLLETTLVRVGNEEYAEANKSFGLTTMRDRHARVAGAKVRMEFNGKSGVDHEIDIREPRLARIVEAMPGSPRPGIIPVRRRTRRRARRWIFATSTIICGKSVVTTSPPRIFGRGPGLHSPLKLSRSLKTSTQRPPPNAT